MIVDRREHRACYIPQCSVRYESHCQLMASWLSRYCMTRQTITDAVYTAFGWAREVVPSVETFATTLIDLRSFFCDLPIMNHADLHGANPGHPIWYNSTSQIVRVAVKASSQRSLCCIVLFT